MAHDIDILSGGQTDSAAGGVALSAAFSCPRPPVRSLYIHVPFCAHKCHYCDFYSFVDNRDRQGAFTDRLIGELRELAPWAAGAPLETVFVGGGTPSLLAVEHWERLLAAMGGLFDLSLLRRAGTGAEFTVECNPESAGEELMHVLRAGGVNRVSIGAQSFQPRHLKTLERWHDPENVGRALERAAAAGIERRSIDLIYGVPGQSVTEWTSDLERALALGVDHLSCYGLTYEPNTAMTARLRQGQFEPVDEEVEAEMYLLTVSRLGEAGLRRYEVSNFARSGQESAHNLVYWRQGQWLAAGPSASGHVWAGHEPCAGGWRWKNVPRLGDYLDSAGLSPVVDVEGPDPSRALRERIMTGLRLAEGIDSEVLLRDAAGIGPDEVGSLEREARRLVDEGLMEMPDGNWRPTERGFLLADLVVSRLMGAV